MNKRPKSREETPKEGSDSARRYRTATICDRDAQKARVFDTFPVQSSPGLPNCNNRFNPDLYIINQTLKYQLQPALRAVRCWYAKALNFVIAAVIEKYTTRQG
jgi:hypothetical protein